MKLGKFVRIEYTGTLENGDVFDSTDPKVIESAMGSVTIILGAGHVIKGMEKALFDMKMGEARELEIDANDGFGKRDSKKIKLYKLKNFTKENIRPYPNMRVTVEGQMATIKSVSSGRVVVDFNHLLAGRTLKYKLKLIEEVIDKEERIKELMKFHFGKEIEFTTDGNKIVLSDIPEYFQERLRDELATYTDFKNIRFIISKGEKDEEHNQSSGEKNK